MAIGRRTALIIVVGGVALLLGAFVLVLPALVRVDRYRPQITSFLHEKLGKEVEIGRLSLSWFPLAIHVDGFGVKNPPIFPSGYVVKIAQADAELDFRALLHRQVIIRSLVLDNPILHLTSDPDGPWNFENPEAKASQRTFPLGMIWKVQIRRGELVASNLLPSDKQGPVFFEAHEVSCDLEDVNLIGLISSSSSASDGRGSLKAGRLSFGTVDAKNLNSTFQLTGRQVAFTDVKAELYGGTAAGALFFDMSGKNAAFKTNANFSGISVPSRFNDLGPAKDNPASFNMISTDLELANLRITSKKIDIDGYGVDIDGAGNVNVDGSGELNYDGVAQITTPQGFFTRTFARLAGATVKDGKVSFPFHIGGTIASPLFAKVERVD